MVRDLFPATPFGAVLGLGEKYKDKPAEASDTGGLGHWVLNPTLDFQAIILHAYISGTNDINQYLEADVNSLEDVMTNWMVHTELGLQSAMQYAEETYPSKEVWMTEWGILMPGFTDPSYEPIFRNMTLTVMQSASMYLEMLKYNSLTLANHHGMVPMLNPIYDEDDNLLRFERTTHGDLVAYLNKLYASAPIVLSSSIEGAGEVTSPIVNPNGSGWGGNSVSSIADVFFQREDEYHWLAINRESIIQDVVLQLHEIEIQRAAIEVARFYTTEVLPPEDTFDGTLDLLAPATQDKLNLHLQMA